MTCPNTSSGAVYPIMLSLNVIEDILMLNMELFIISDAIYGCDKDKTILAIVFLMMVLQSPYTPNKQSGLSLNLIFPFEAVYTRVEYTLYTLEWLESWSHLVDIGSIGPDDKSIDTMLRVVQCR
jgi:hypothetical protein